MGPNDRHQAAPVTSPTRNSEEAEILHIRHYSLYAPADFDLSPYFEIVKPTLEQGFNYKGLTWARDALVSRRGSLEQ